MKHETELLLDDERELPVVKKIEQQADQRIIAVGDIHGNRKAVDNFVNDQEIAGNFDSSRDRIIGVGDLTDRGEDSYGSLSLLREEFFTACLGNHEAFNLAVINEIKSMVDINPENLSKDIRTRMLAYGSMWLFDHLKHLDEIEDLISSMPYAFEIAAREKKETIGVVHAEIPKGMSWFGRNGFAKQLENSVREGDTMLKNKNSVVSHALNGRERFTDFKKQQRSKPSIFPWRNKKDLGVPDISKLFVGHTTDQSTCQLMGNILYLDTNWNKGRTTDRSKITFVDILATPKQITTVNAPIHGEGYRFIPA